MRDVGRRRQPGVAFGSNASVMTLVIPYIRLVHSQIGRRCG